MGVRLSVFGPWGLGRDFGPHGRGRLRVQFRVWGLGLLFSVRPACSFLWVFQVVGEASCSLFAAGSRM